MSHSSYTASERRGILAIATIALALIGGGAALSLCSRERAEAEELPVVIEHPELIDSLAVKEKEEKSGKKKREKATKGSKSTKKEKKVYRRRSPLDEPV